MLDISSKGTVPVLVVDGEVIDESLDIMLWALSANDPESWLSQYDDTDKASAMQLIKQNDEEFKVWLDKYKYADRHLEYPQEFYRDQCTEFLQTLESALQNNLFLMGSTISLADIAIFPFIRQFAMVDKNWFDQCAYPVLREWLNRLLGLPFFSQVMAKNPASQAQ